MDKFMNGIPKKNSTIESFFKRNSTDLNCNSLKSYETCVIDIKGSLVLCYVILTNDSLLVARNPPSSFTHIIRLSWIQDIKVIADREPLVRGGHNNSICQHVRIFYQGGSEVSKGQKGLTYVNDVELTEDSSRASSVFEGSLKADEEYLTHMPISILQAFDPSYGLPSSKADSGFSSDDVSESDSTEIKFLDSTNQSTTTEKSTLESPFRSSSVIEQKLLFWRKDKRSRIDENELTKRPSSVDIPQLSKLRRILLIKNGFSKNSKPSKGTKKHADSEIRPLNLYFYKADSNFLNELCLFWNRQLLGHLPELNHLNMNALLTEKGSSTGVQIAESMLERMVSDETGGLKILFSSTTIKSLQTKVFPEMLSVLYLLHKMILKYDDLASLCLKSSVLLTNLQILMKRSLIMGKVGNVNNEEVFRTRNSNNEKFANYTNQTNDTSLVMTKVSIHVLLMEIFRLLLLQSTSTAQLNIGTSTLISDELVRKGQKPPNNNNRSSSRRDPQIKCDQVVEIILNSIFTFACLIEFNYNTKTVELVSDQGNHNSKDEELVKLLCINHNTSTAVLHDILTVAHFSPKYMASTSVRILLETFNLEPYLKQSMTQVINLVWSAQETLTFAQCTLLHRQVIVLTHLVQHSRLGQDFMKQAFCEEFRYFMNGESTNLKIPDQYPVKAKLLVACNALRNTVIT